MRPLLALVLFGGVVHAADDADLIARTRVRQGWYVGPSVVRGGLSFRAPTAAIDTRLDAVPAVALGADLWPAPELGLHLALHVGLGADVGVPDSTATIGYNLHQLEAGGRYRWHLGPRADAVSVQLGLALRGTIQTAQVQRPSFIVDRTALGPEAQAALVWPVAGWRCWLSLQAHAGLPFFVREGPTDSGDPRGFVTYGGQAAVVLGVTPAWAVQVQADWRTVELDFAGEGTRTGGVTDAEVSDQFLTADLLLRRVF
ncbi:MAG: hypothetical protein KC549_05655 [Myxococcales bacterium]|nr:hypothetical protein [Myxococcales bacterium]MCB9546616.1 hypothetical protein [Myxococcales bacterium]